jgi:hypothetical protein
MLPLVAPMGGHDLEPAQKAAADAAASQIDGLRAAVAALG